MRLVSVRFLSVLLLAGSTVACGGDDDTTDDMASPDGGGGDTTAPTLVSITPADGATGIEEDAVVTLVFSEAMDQESVEGTLDAEDLGTVTLTWNAAGDTLTVTPEEPLAYAEGLGTDPAAVTANSFSVVLGSAALDLAGNALGTGDTSTFTTLKSISHVFELDDAMSRSLTAEGDVLFDADSFLGVGDLDDDRGVRALFTFDIGLLPLSTTGIASATFATRQEVGNIAGAPFGDDGDDDGLGEAVLIDHVSYTALDNAAFNASQDAHAQLGDFCVLDQVVIEIDVTDAVEDDFQNRDDRGDVSQYLLRFALDNDQDEVNDGVAISRANSELQVTYLAP